MIITHTKVSTIADGGDTSLIRPSDWNAQHTIGNISGFRAHSTTGQVIPSTVETKINFSVEDYDIMSEYDSTNSRFSPSVAGRYLCAANIHMIVLPTAKTAILSIQKNGAVYSRGDRIVGVQDTVSASIDIIMNLSATEYVEISLYHTSTNSLTLEQPNITFEACRIA